MVLSPTSLSVVYPFVSSSSSHTDGNTIKQDVSRTPHTPHARMISTRNSLYIYISLSPGSLLSHACPSVCILHLLYTPLLQINSPLIDFTTQGCAMDPSTSTSYRQQRPLRGASVSSSRDFARSRTAPGGGERWGGRRRAGDINHHTRPALPRHRWGRSVVWPGPPAATLLPSGTAIGGWPYGPRLGAGA